MQDLQVLMSKFIDQSRFDSAGFLRCIGSPKRNMRNLTVQSAADGMSLVHRFYLLHDEGIGHV
ncbi:hypothetical protein BTO02_06060 [Paraburkholderia sp. SOS3]|nr:hypothetical protein BTO02_06060 [Paraburkholderia sp. SOS3]